MRNVYRKLSAESNRNFKLQAHLFELLHQPGLMRRQRLQPDAQVLSLRCLSRCLCPAKYMHIVC
jgi:hypothetical protein